MADTQLPQKRARRKWTEEDLRAEAMKYSTRVGFKLAQRSAYQQACARGLLNEICAHMSLKRHQWSDDDLATEALKYNSRSEFQKLKPGIYKEACKRGILQEICLNIKPQRRTWTDEELYEEASKYKTRTEFQESNASAYSIAARRGILEDILKNTPSMYRRWTNEEIIAEAKRFRYRAEFKNKNLPAYKAASRRGILDDVCSHMNSGRRSCPSDNDAIYLWRVKNTAIFKVGVTSTRLDLDRINNVSLLAGLTPELVIYTTCSDPKTVEQQVLQLGMPVQFDRPFNGHTEFRWLGPAELSEAVRLIASNSWLNKEKKSDDHHNIN